MNKGALRHACSTIDIVFEEEHSLIVMTVHVEKRWRKYHPSDVAGKCMDQSAGHQ